MLSLSWYEQSFTISGPDFTRVMARLVWAIALHTADFAGFDMQWLIYENEPSRFYCIKLDVGFYQLRKGHVSHVHLGESFQDFSWIQDFKAESAAKCWIRQIIIVSQIYFHCII